MAAVELRMYDGGTEFDDWRADSKTTEITSLPAIPSPGDQVWWEGGNRYVRNVNYDAEDEEARPIVVLVNSMNDVATRSE